jgi:uncharacterized OsmC-like protein
MLLISKLKGPFKRIASFRSQSMKSYYLSGEGVKMQTNCVIGAGDSNETLFHLKTDIPKLMGGSNTAPQPVEMFLASLVGCEQATAMYVARHLPRPLVINKIDFNVYAERDPSGSLTLPLGSLPSSDIPPARLTRIYGTATVYSIPAATHGSSSSTSSNTDNSAVSQEEVDLLHREVNIRCPIVNMVLLSGCEVDIQWVVASRN